MSRHCEPMSRRDLIKWYGLSALLLQPVLRSMAYAAPMPFAKTDSPWLIVVPLMVLGFMAVVAGYINAAPFKIHLFERWIESSIGLPIGEGGIPEPAAFEWVNCGLCVDERGATSIDGPQRGGPKDFAAMVLSTDNTLIIPAK